MPNTKSVPRGLTAATAKYPLATTVMVDDSIKALDLHGRGCSKRTIASRLGIPISEVGGLLEKGLRRVGSEPAEATIRLIINRLENLLEAHMEKALAGDPRATSICLSIIDKQLRVCGGYSGDRAKQIFAEAARSAAEANQTAATSFADMVSNMDDGELFGGSVIQEINAMVVSDGNSNPD